MSPDELHLTMRNLRSDDYAELKALMDTVYPDIGGAWGEHTIQRLIKDFPEGQLCLEDNGKVVGVALTVMVKYARFSNPHTYDDLMDTRQNILNDRKGDALYGLDVLIHPNYRGYRLGRRLYDSRKELCRQLNLKAILAGGRIVNYHKYAEQLSPGQYIEQVHRREIYDPILTFQLANDFTVKRLLGRYLPEDKRSAGFATLLEWDNFLYEASDNILGSRIRNVRVGAIQWQMRAVASVEEMLRQVEYFVDAVSNYQSDFAVFPEFFNAPLMGLTDQSRQKDAIRFLAGYTDRFKREMSQMAVSYNVNIITGSMPLDEDDVIYNVSYLCRRDGTVEEQRKIHVTPHEKRDWVIEGGDQVQVFDTDAGRVGILICYDVEFPELGRLMAAEGLEILFVPFWTDTRNSYLRVRHCAQARAVENECYVVTCGSVGNLPQVESLDVQYAQSAVFSPSDFAFPYDAILAETTPNTEQLIFSDLNLDELRYLHHEGSVMNLKDRRTDLYEVVRKR